MTGALGYVRESLAGAWLVMLGRPEGLKRLDLSITGFWRSFAAIALVLPFALLALMSQRRLAQASGEAPEAVGIGGPGPEALALAADWILFPLIFALLARPLGLGGRYVPFVVARNWGAVVVAAIVAVFHAAHLVGILPSAAMPFMLLVAIAVALRFAYAIARTALSVSFRIAIPVVLLDLLISMTVWSAFDRLG